MCFIFLACVAYKRKSVFLSAVPKRWTSSVTRSTSITILCVGKEDVPHVINCNWWLRLLIVEDMIYEAAFDKISRRNLFVKLVNMGISSLMLPALIEMYSVTESYVDVNGEYSKVFNMTTNFFPYLVGSYIRGGQQHPWWAATFAVGSSFRGGQQHLRWAATSAVGSNIICTPLI